MIFEISWHQWQKLFAFAVWAPLRTCLPCPSHLWHKKSMICRANFNFFGFLATSWVGRSDVGSLAFTCWDQLKGRRCRVKLSASTRMQITQKAVAEKMEDGWPVGKKTHPKIKALGQMWERRSMFVWFPPVFFYRKLLLLDPWVTCSVLRGVTDLWLKIGILYAAGT